MKAHWTLRRYICAGFALGLFFFTIGCFILASECRKQVAEWQHEKPIDTVVDFSSRGQFVAPLNPTCSCSLRLFVTLRIPTAAIKGTTIVQLLQGAQARMDVFRKGQTNIIDSSDLNPGQSSHDGTIPIFSLKPLEKGTYEARLTITVDAPAMKGIPQKLESFYAFCGNQLALYDHFEFFGISALILGGVTIAILLYRMAHFPVHKRSS